MFAIALIALPLQAGVLGDSLYGTVRAAGTGEAVPGVQVSLSGRLQIAVSDSSGRYVLLDVPGGRSDLRFERVGFEALAVSVIMATGTATRVDVDLASRPVHLQPVSIPGDASGDMTSADPTVEGVQFTGALVARNPLVGASDPLFEAVATAPFNNGRSELAPSLHVRGGAGDETLVLIDGLPWRGPRPLGGIAGLLPATAVASVEVHTIAPPARYGDALSSTVVVRPKSVDHLALDGVVDGTVVEQTVGVPLPLDHATLLVSGRWTFQSVFNPPEGGESENGFRTGLARLSVPAGAGGLNFYYLDARDRLAFPATSDPASSLTNDFAATGSLAGIVWTRPGAPGRSLHARAWYGDATGSGQWGTMRVSSNLRDFGFTAEYERARTELGLGVSRVGTEYRVLDSTGSVFNVRGAPLIASASVMRRWLGRSTWSAATGLRIHATADWGLRFEPRLATRVALGPRFAVAFGYARIYQYVQSARNEESPMDAVLGMDLPIATMAGRLPPARSDQVTATIESRLGARASIRLEGYARRLSGLALVASATRLPFAEGAIPIGRSSVRGVEGSFSYEDRRVAMRAQASLVSALRTTTTIRYRPGGDMERVTLGVAYRVSRFTAIRIAMFVADGRFTTPLEEGLQLDPYIPLDGAGALSGTPVPISGPLNEARLPTYERVDLGLTREWELPPRGAGARISTSLTILNLFDRHNVFAYVVSRDGRRPVLLLPRTVSLRLRWRLGRSD